MEDTKYHTSLESTRYVLCMLPGDCKRIDRCTYKRLFCPNGSGFKRSAHACTLCKHKPNQAMPKLKTLTFPTPKEGLSAFSMARERVRAQPPEQLCLGDFLLTRGKVARHVLRELMAAASARLFQFDMHECELQAPYNKDRL